MEEDLRALILADAGVAGVVGGRVSWAERPQGGALPAIVLHLISQPVEYHTQGAVALRQSRVQADCWGATYGSAKAAARALAELLSGFVGEHGATAFQGVFQANARDTRDAGTDDADRFFRASIDFLVNHQPKG